MIIEADSNGPQFNMPDPSMDPIASGEPSAAPSDPSMPEPDMSGAPDIPTEDEEKPEERVEEPKSVEDFMTNAKNYAKTSQNDPVAIMKGIKADIQNSPDFNTKEKVEEILTAMVSSEDNDIKSAGERLKRYLSIESELENAN